MFICDPFVMEMECSVGRCCLCSTLCTTISSIHYVMLRNQAFLLSDFAKSRSREVWGQDCSASLEFNSRHIDESGNQNIILWIKIFSNGHVVFDHRLDTLTTKYGLVGKRLFAFMCVVWIFINTRRNISFIDIMSLRRLHSKSLWNDKQYTVGTDTLCVCRCFVLVDHAMRIHDNIQEVRARNHTLTPIMDVQIQAISRCMQLTVTTAPKWIKVHIAKTDFACTSVKQHTGDELHNNGFIPPRWRIQTVIDTR